MHSTCATWRAACLVLVIAGALVWPRRGAAESACLARLALSGPKGARSCPSEQELRDAVAGRLGYDPFCADAEPEVRAAIRRTGSGWAGELTLRSNGVVRGRRDIDAYAGCDQLAAALSLAISIALDPLGAAQGKAAPPPPAPPPEPAPPPPPQAPQDPPERQVRLELLGGGGIDGGALPRAGMAWEAGAAAAWPRWALGLVASFDAPVTAPAWSGRLRAWEAGLTLLPCRRASWLEGCLALGAGLLQVEGQDLVRTRRAGAAYAWAGVRGGVRLPLGERTSIALSGTVGADLLRARVTVSDEQVWRSPAARWGLRLGLAWRP